VQKEKNVMIACRITEKQAHELKIACAIKKKTVQAILSEAIVKFIEEKTPE
jgi:hypothetical protein